MSLVEAGPGHHAAIAVLHRRCFEDAWSSATIRQILAMPGAFGLLAVGGPGPGGGPDLLGFVLCRLAADECEVLSLAVAPAARNRGIGDRLLAAAVARVREARARRVFLEVAEDNMVAQRLYRGHGFRRVGRRPGYYARTGAPAVAALTLALDLDGGADGA